MILKKYFYNSLLILGTILFCLVLSEFGIRLFLPIYDPSGMVKFIYNPKEGPPLGVKNSTTRQWKNTGDYDVTINFNRYGLRDKKDLKESSINDIWVIGDSMSFGWGVEEEQRYSNLVDEKIDEKVYNLSIPTGLNGYEKLLNYAINNGAKVKNIILGLVMENDLMYSDSSDAPETEKNETFSFLFKKLFYNVKIRLTESSALYNAITSSIHHNRYLKDLAIRSGLIVGYVDGIHDEFAYDEQALQRTVTRINRVFKEHNLLVLVIPSRALWAGNDLETNGKIHNKFIEYLHQYGIDYLDLRPVFEKNSKKPLKSFHFKNDGHWNQSGHMAAAEAVINYLNESYQNGTYFN